MNTKLVKLCSFGLALTAITLLPYCSFAEDSKEKEPRLGNLAGSGVTNANGSRGYVGADAFGEDKNPITGSMSKKSNSCVLKVFNNSDDRYSASVAGIGMDKDGKVTKRDTFSFTLGAKQSSERSMTVGSNTTNCSLELTSARNLSPKKDDAENKETATIAQ